MARARERVCLQDGLKLDLNRLVRNGFIKRGANIGSCGIRWTHSYWGEIASGMISADMSGYNDGWLRVRLGNLDQTIILVALPRHFGGKQWYFMCPVRNRPASVLWKPSGATRFCSRQTWGRQVAYQSQFNDATNRAHGGRPRSNLGCLGTLIRTNGICHRNQSGCGGPLTIATWPDSTTMKIF